MSAARPTDTAACTLRAGVATVDITPTDLTGLHPIMGGSFLAVHDPIHARALVLDDGAMRAALVTLDLIEVGDTRTLRSRVATETGIPADRVFLVASHSHSAPRYGRVSPGALAHDGGPEVDRYSRRVDDAVVGAITAASAALQEVVVSTGTGHVDVSVNRDEYCRDADAWHLGVRPDGPSDKTLRLLALTPIAAPEGAPLAALLGYAVHPTASIGTRHVSADLVGAALAHVERELPGVTALWIPGALGDQNPRVALPPERGLNSDSPDREYAWEAVTAQGTMLGAEAVRVLTSCTHTPLGSPHLFAAQERVELPVKAGTDVMEDMVQAAVDTVPLTLGLLRIGDTALSTVSGEIVEAIGERLRAASPLRDTWVACLTNDRVGYLPEAEAFRLSTFEVNGCPCVRGTAEDAIVSTALKLIEESK